MSILVTTLKDYQAEYAQAQYDLFLNTYGDEARAFDEALVKSVLAGNVTYDGDITPKVLNKVLRAEQVLIELNDRAFLSEGHAVKIIGDDYMNSECGAVDRIDGDNGSAYVAKTAGLHINPYNKLSDKGLRHIASGGPFIEYDHSLFTHTAGDDTELTFWFFPEGARADGGLYFSAKIKRWTLDLHGVGG